ncbi:COMM domain-containing protein 7-like [Ylistrum balloti]|uniref:COMM domain-containing protein 7-like n=1 Tax=Ylistrum balloti TaxID=509963 RepID=UPI00290599A5|nr:COMM domain-containing protein 7-like [Ylistrum balloti]
MASTFHFSKETPPDTVFSDIQMVNKFQDEQFCQLVEYSLEFLADPGKSQKLMEQLGEFAESNGVGASALKNVFKSLLLVPNSALKKSLSPSQLQEDLVNLGLSTEKANYFSDQWKANLAALSRSALGQTLMVNQLLDMEWKFGGEYVCDNMSYTFVVYMVINTGNGYNNTYMLHMYISELTLPQFYSFLHEMEKAKASLEYLS